MELNIHYDCDGVIRNFHSKAFELFFKQYPEYKDKLLPLGQFKGWGWDKQFRGSPAEVKKIDKVLTDYVFNNKEVAYEIFSTAKPFVSRDEWKRHVEMIRKEFPDANLTISTHQYNDVAREATTYWLGKNGFTDEDDINILYTGRKELFGAHFLFDDKPKMIEKFHVPYEAIGVLRINPYSNSWYVKEKKGKLDFPYAKTLEGYYKIISEKAIELL